MWCGGVWIRVLPLGRPALFQLSLPGGGSAHRKIWRTLLKKNLALWAWPKFIITPQRYQKSSWVTNVAWSFSLDSLCRHIKGTVTIRRHSLVSRATVHCYPPTLQSLQYCSQRLSQLLAGPLSSSFEGESEGPWEWGCVARVKAFGGWQFIVGFHVISKSTMRARAVGENFSYIPWLSVTLISIFWSQIHGSLLTSLTPRNTFISTSFALISFNKVTPFTKHSTIWIMGLTFNWRWYRNYEKKV